jgi:hypothetical protein
MRLFAILFLFNTLMLVAEANAQDNVYDVIVAGRTIGSLKVFEDNKSDERGTHRIESDFKVLFYSGKYSTQTSYEDGQLVNAVSAHHVNGDLKEKTQTKSIAKSAYSVSFSGDDGEKKKSKEFTKPILNTVTSLYYKEPVNISEVYSERYGQMCTVKKLADGSYSVSLPDGKQSLYTYKNGVCREIKTDLSGFKLRIVLNQQKTSQ